MIKTIEDNPDLTSVIRPSIQKYEKQLNDITNQINQLKNQQNEDKTLFDAKEISKLLQHIFHDIKHIEKSRLKALYLSVIDRIDIKKMVIIKQFYVTLKLNNEIIKQLFNNNNSTKCISALRLYFAPNTISYYLANRIIVITIIFTIFFRLFYLTIFKNSLSISITLI